MWGLIMEKGKTLREVCEQLDKILKPLYGINFTIRCKDGRYSFEIPTASGHGHKFFSFPEEIELFNNRKQK
jgi:hypothetical protein